MNSKQIDSKETHYKLKDSLRYFFSSVKIKKQIKIVEKEIIEKYKLIYQLNNLTYGFYKNINENIVKFQEASKAREKLEYLKTRKYFQEINNKKDELTETDKQIEYLTFLTDNKQQFKKNIQEFEDSCNIALGDIEKNNLDILALNNKIYVIIYESYIDYLEKDIKKLENKLNLIKNNKNIINEINRLKDIKKETQEKYLELEIYINDMIQDFKVSTKVKIIIKDDK